MTRQEIFVLILLIAVSPFAFLLMPFILAAAVIGGLVLLALGLRRLWHHS